MSHGLTFIVLTYFFLSNFDKPSELSYEDADAYKVADEEHVMMLQMIGFIIYFAVFVAMMISYCWYKCKLGKPWENQSVRCGIYLVKAAMLVGGKTGPALYCCLLIQLYYFSIIVSHRVESEKSLPFSCFFILWTMQQYFFRGSHRENFAAIQFGKVCPGGVYCGEDLHWILIFFELLAPLLIPLLLLPIIVRDRPVL
jgi:hypothetical protein